MSTHYDSLSLDDIHVISAADDAHACEIDEQADASRDLIAAVNAALDRLGRAHRHISQEDLEQVSKALTVDGKRREAKGGIANLVAGAGAAFEGESARAAIDRVTKLHDTSGAGRDQLDAQPQTFSVLSAQVRRTHSRLSQLRDDRDAWLKFARANPNDPQLAAEFGTGGWWNPDPAQVATAIGDRYDTDARDYMQSNTDEYLRQAASLGAPDIYDGPRTPRGGTGGHGGTGGDAGPAGNGHHSASGPSLRPNALDTSTVSAPDGYSHHPDLASTPSLQGPVTMAPAPAAPTVPSGLGAGGVFTPPLPVVPPVIGARGTTTPAIAPRTPALAPRAAGVTRPVIGERAGKAINAFGRPQRPVVRPTRPANPLARPPRATPRPEEPTTRTRPLSSEPFGTNESRPGVRAAPPRSTPPAGRVIRANRASAEVTRPEFTRAPRAAHGGADSLNRAVIRNSRALSAPAQQPRPPAPPTEEETVEPVWNTTPHTVRPVIRPGTTDTTNQDPGPFLTRHNLGRRD